MTTVRLSVSLPDDLYAQVQRVAQASRVSAASIVRAAVAELIPRTSRLLDFLGSEPVVTPEEVAEVDAWGAALQRFLADTPAPPVLRPMVEDLEFRTGLAAPDAPPGGAE